SLNVFRLAVSTCLRAKIPTLSSCRPLTRDNYDLSLRLLRYEISRDSPEDSQPRPKSPSRDRARNRPGGRLGQSLSRPRVCPPRGGHDPAHLGLQPPALCALVGESSYRRRGRRGPDRVDALGLRSVPVPPTTSAFQFLH